LHQRTHKIVNQFNGISLFFSSGHEMVRLLFGMYRTTPLSVYFPLFFLHFAYHYPLFFSCGLVFLFYFSLNHSTYALNVCLFIFGIRFNYDIHAALAMHAAHASTSLRIR